MGACFGLGILRTRDRPNASTTHQTANASDSKRQTSQQRHTAHGWSRAKTGGAVPRVIRQCRSSRRAAPATQAGVEGPLEEATIRDISDRTRCCSWHQSAAPAEAAALAIAPKFTKSTNCQMIIIKTQSKKATNHKVLHS